MLVEKLKQTAENLVNWNFNYGKEYWQNLGDYPDDANLPFSERQKYLLLLWKDRTFLLNNMGGVQGSIFTGEMVLLVRSKISDESYDYKYETHIKNLEAESEKLFHTFLNCEGWMIKTWKEIEVENEFDTNMDGLKITFTIEFE